jgi:hypothetical protein
MITDEDTARRTPGLANVRISGQTDRRRLPESGLRARRPVVGYILNQCDMTARPAWARAYRRWGLQTRQHILFSDESRCSLRSCMGVIVCTVGVGKDLRTSVCTSSTVLEAEVMVALSSKLFKEH